MFHGRTHHRVLLWVFYINTVDVRGLPGVHVQVWLSCATLTHSVARTVWQFPTLLRHDSHRCKSSKTSTWEPVREPAFQGSCGLYHRPTLGRRMIRSSRVCDTRAPSMCQWHFLQVATRPGILQCLGTPSGSERPTLNSFLRQEALELLLRLHPSQDVTASSCHPT